VSVAENIVHLFIHYGIIQGLVLAVWLFLHRRQKVLSFFFLSLSFLLFIFLFEIEGWYKIAPHLIWTNVPVWFLIAPLLFLHTKKAVKPSENKLNIKDLAHFLPAVVAVIYVFPFYLNSVSEKIEIFQSFYSQTSNIDYVQLLYFLQILSYAIIGTYKIRNYLRNINEQNSNSKFIHLQLISSMYYILIGYILVAIAITLVIKFAVNAGWEVYALSFFTLSLTILLATYLLLNSYFANQENFLKMDYKLSNEIEIRKTKYSTSSLDDNDMKKILMRLETIMLEKKPYQNPELKLSDLAKLSGIPSHHISQSLNQVKGISFFNFVNQYRVEAVISKLKNNQQQSVTLLAIAEECGFNSESSFYRIFKTVTGKTPNSYWRRK
jgi:AraC-like DNA-binding protein